jgi:ribosomal protein S18 acetylase RimI-like enzyme
MQVRRANMKDMMEMQQCNLRCLPENYNLRYYYYHYLSWPQELYVLEDVNNRIAGYVLAKLDDEEDPKKKHGHITSLAVLRSHRKLGAASALMRNSMQSMREVDESQFCSLHVRKTNAAALHLYQDSLRFRCVDVEKEYYVDNEDAYHMKRFFKMPGSEGGSSVAGGGSGKVKIAYITPSGDFKWTTLDSEQLKYLNADIPNFGNANAAGAGGNEKKSEQTSSGGGAVASSSEKQTANNNNNNNNKKQKGAAASATSDAAIAAQLEELGEGKKNNAKKEEPKKDDKKKGKK